MKKSHNLCLSKSIVIGLWLLICWIQFHSICFRQSTHWCLKWSHRQCCDIKEVTDSAATLVKHRTLSMQVIGDIPLQDVPHPQLMCIALSHLSMAVELLQQDGPAAHEEKHVVKTSTICAWWRQSIKRPWAQLQQWIPKSWTKKEQAWDNQWHQSLWVILQQAGLASRKLVLNIGLKMSKKLLKTQSSIPQQSSDACSLTPFKRQRKEEHGLFLITIHGFYLSLLLLCSSDNPGIVRIWPVLSPTQCGTKDVNGAITVFMDWFCQRQSVHKCWVHLLVYFAFFCFSAEVNEDFWNLRHPVSKLTKCDWKKIPNSTFVHFHT